MLNKYFKSQLDTPPEAFDFEGDEAGYFYEHNFKGGSVRFVIDDYNLHAEVFPKGAPEDYEHFIWSAPETAKNIICIDQCAAIGSALIEELEAGAKLYDVLESYGLESADI